MKRRNKIFLIVLVSISLLGIIFGTIDYSRIKNNKLPIFMVRITSASKQKLNYIGLGYRMQRYVGVSYKEPLTSDNYIKFGLWIYTFDISINNENQKLIQNNIRYEEILDSLEKANKLYIDATFVIRNEYNCTVYKTAQSITADGLISNMGLLKQHEMLDVDGKSYCKATIYNQATEYDGETCEIETEIHLKCKDYETPGYLEHPDLLWPNTP